MGKRILDIVVAGLALCVVSPLLLVAAIGITLSSPGPIFYCSKRIGRDFRRLRPDARPSPVLIERRIQRGYLGREFTIYKFRTMRAVGRDIGNPITAANDPRVFAFGAFLRTTKIDELPQLVNVVKGEMAIVGPRPEAPEIVRNHYTRSDLATLQVRPGLTSPGTIYYYTHCESSLDNHDVVDAYLSQVLPLKLALDRVYLRRASVLYDVRLIVRTVVTIAGRMLGRRRFPNPPELMEATAERRSFSRAERGSLPA